MSKTIVPKGSSHCQYALSLKRDLEANFLTLASLLCLIKRDRLYENEYEAWWVFLDDLRLTEATASKLMKVYTTFIEQYKIAPAKVASSGGWSVYTKYCLLLKMLTLQKNG